MREYLAFAARDPIQAMKTIGEIRHTNLLTLIDRYGGNAELNERLGLARNDATVSQLKNRSPDSKTGAPKTMGDKFARHIEVSLGLEHGWMDNDHSVTRYGEGAIATVLAAMEAMTPLQQKQLVKVVAALAEPSPKASNGE